MFKSFKTFFNPPTWAYSYNLPKEVVVAKISEIFKKEVGLSSDNSMSAEFLTNDKFKIEVRSVAYTKGVKYSSTLTGEIVQEENKTIIKTTVTPAIIFYFLLLLAIVLSIIWLYVYFQTYSVGLLLRSLAALVISPLVIFWLSRVNNYSVQERYVLHIHKVLKALSQAGNS